MCGVDGEKGRSGRMMRIMVKGQVVWNPGNKYKGGQGSRNDEPQSKKHNKMRQTGMNHKNYVRVRPLLQMRELRAFL